ncbi:MAG: SHOCT domain-containing protein [Actinomycetota bacterium]|nr:SHOCT domain-containing protein [Actinomycetota bacterium]
MPLLDLIWVMLMWFLFFAWILVIGSVVADVFRSHDLSGLAKAGWVVFVIVIPWLGVVVYLIARGESMTFRYSEAVAARSRDNRTYVRTTASYSDADQLASLHRRREAGLVSGMDFDTQKARILA